MIIANIQDLKKYQALSEHFHTAIAYIQNNNLLELPVGKYPIDGENVFILRDQYYPKPQAECFFESHQRYADLQMVLKGTEAFGTINAASQGIIVTDPYNPEKDMVKYLAGPELMITLKPGNCVIVFPEDLHLVKVKLDEEMVEKVVVKIKL